MNENVEERHVNSKTVSFIHTRLEHFVAEFLELVRAIPCDSFPAFCTLCKGISILFVFQGNGLFAKKDFHLGDVIFEEVPLVMCQFAWNADCLYTSCEHCLRPLETAEENARRLSGNRTLSLPVQSSFEEIETSNINFMRWVKSINQPTSHFYTLLVRSKTSQSINRTLTWIHFVQPVNQSINHGVDCLFTLMSGFRHVFAHSNYFECSFIFFIDFIFLIASSFRIWIPSNLRNIAPAWHAERNTAAALVRRLPPVSTTNECATSRSPITRWICCEKHGNKRIIHRKNSTWWPLPSWPPCLCLPRQMRENCRNSRPLWLASSPTWRM